MSVTTEQLIVLAKEGADLTNVADYVTNATWLSWLQNGVNELHRFVTNKFKKTYYRTYDFTLAAGESQITLPSNFWRLSGLDIDADTARRREVRPFNFAERNRYRQNATRDLSTFANDRFYNLVGSSILKIQAEEQAAGSYRLYYTPKPRTLLLVRSITMDPGDDTSDGLGLLTFDVDTSFTSADVGNLLTLDGCVDAADDRDYEILTVPSTSSITVSPAPPAALFDADTTATVSTPLDPELEPYSEYVWLTAAIKSLTKEESYAQAKELKEQRNLIRLDLLEALETDSGGPATVIDTDGDDIGDW
jgi:hypothetical protein